MSTTSQPTSYIYGLIDPTNGMLRYIGKSNNPLVRRYQHVCASQLAAKTHRNHWIKSLLVNGNKPEVVVLEEIPDSEWEIAESWWIEYWKFLGASLVNGTSGGDGLHNPTIEVRRKIGDSTRGKKRVFTEEHKSKIAQRNRERVDDPEWLSNARKNLALNRNKIGHLWSAESRLKASESAKRRGKGELCRQPHSQLRIPI